MLSKKYLKKGIFLYKIYLRNNSRNGRNYTNAFKFHRLYSLTVEWNKIDYPTVGSDLNKYELYKYLKNRKITR